MARIVWNAEQKALVAKQAYAIYISSGMSFKSSLQEAMCVLPRPIRRDIAAMSGSQIKAIYELAEVQRAAEKAAPVVQSVVLETNQSKAIACSMAKMEARAKNIESDLKVRMEALIKLESSVNSAIERLAITSDKVSQLLSQIDESNVELDLARDELAVQLSSVKQLIAEAAPVKKHGNHVHGVTAKATKHDRLKVMIVGLLNDQAEMLKREYGERIKFTFLATDSAIRNITSRASGMDYVFTTKFVDHSHAIPLRSMSNYQHVVGGMTNFRDILSNLK